MGPSWVKVSVVAIALAAPGGCCPDPEPDPDKVPDDGRLHCNMLPDPGVRVRVKGTAQYTTQVTGDAVVEGITYWAGEDALGVDDPEQPFSATAELEVGDLFSSYSIGHMTDGSIFMREVFTPADGSPITVYELTCGTGPLP